MNADSRDSYELVPNEHLYAISLRETGDEVIAVLPDALHQIVSHANVECTVRFTHKNKTKNAMNYDTGPPLARG